MKTSQIDKARKAITHARCDRSTCSAPSAIRWAKKALTRAARRARKADLHDAVNAV